jgi:hypothetical protein
VSAKRFSRPQAASVGGLFHFIKSSNKKNRTVLIPSRREQYYTDRSENFCSAEQLPPLNICVQPGLAPGFSLFVPNFDSRCTMSGWSRRISGTALAVRFMTVPVSVAQPSWHRTRFWVHISSMAFASDIQLVRVTTDVIVDGIARKKLRAAAVPRQLAVGIVLDALPEGWTAALSKKRLTPREMALLKCGWRASGRAMSYILAEARSALFDG